MGPLFNRQRDLRFFSKISKELMGDIVANMCIIYKIAASDIRVDIYGETEGTDLIHYYPGVEVPATVVHEPEQISTDDGLLNKTRSAVYKFNKDTLRDLEIYPEEGDIIEWHNQYFEIDIVIENQIVGGIVSDEHNYSIIAQTHRSRLTSLNIKPVDY